MKLTYLVPDRFGMYKINVVPSHRNPGGGMGVKVQRAIEVWESFYDVKVTEILDSSLDFVVVDPLWFKWLGRYELHSRDYDEVVGRYEDFSGVKILYSTELALLEIPVQYRERIVRASTVVTTPCEWLSGLYRMQNIPSVRLCDPVPESIFYNPSISKTLSVVAMSRISMDKNSEVVLEIFKALEGKPITRIYIGGADLWGGENSADSELECEIRRYCDEFYHNLAQPEIARKLATIGCAIFDTFHDTASESNLEACMSGITSFYGGHGLWDERPGVKGLERVDEFVKAIGDVTNNFTVPPSDTYRKESEEWALSHCSYKQFLKEWKDIWSYVRSQP